MIMNEKPTHRVNPEIPHSTQTFECIKGTADQGMVQFEREKGTTVNTANSNNEVNERDFWTAIRKAAKKLAGKAIRQLLLAWNVMCDPKTPFGAKAIIGGALAYFVLPLDLIPDFLPSGYVDDLAALAAVWRVVAEHLNDDHRRQADQTLCEWGFDGDDEGGPDDGDGIDSGSPSSHDPSAGSSALSIVEDAA